MKKKKLIILCAIIIIVIIAGIFFMIPKTEIIKDIDKYQEVISRNEHKSALTLFPDNITNENVKNFYYQNSKGVLFDSEQLILECYYTEEEYLKENERISKEKNEFYYGNEAYCIHIY